MHNNMPEILIFTLRNLTKLPILRYLGIFVMYNIYGISGPSLLIEPTDSMITNQYIDINEKLIST